MVPEDCTFLQGEFKLFHAVLFLMSGSSVCGAAHFAPVGVHGHQGHVQDRQRRHHRHQQVSCLHAL